MSLLRDMGTVRNMRKFIESKNKSMSIIHGKPQSKRYEHNCRLTSSDEMLIWLDV